MNAELQSKADYAMNSCQRRFPLKRFLCSNVAGFILTFLMQTTEAQLKGTKQKLMLYYS